ncbi:MAG: hypothetical protein LBR37_03510, partial [Erysipelotrichaceae bacterium]|nr:hypothetical protein [Erysipelotrichaceae bacterium]
IPDKERIKKIIDDIRHQDQILGTHDVIVHSYGLKKEFMSIHVEISDRTTLIDAHEIVDHLEGYIKQKYDVELVTHIDPIEQGNPIYNDILKRISLVISDVADVDNFQMHDLRLIKPFSKTKKVVFDLNVPPETKLTYKDIQETIVNKMKDDGFNAVINLEENYLD